MNKIIVSGGLGRDAELKTTANGKNVLEFSLAVNDGFGDNKKTYWWRCALWGDRAVKLAEHFVKGTKLLVEGRPALREYEKDSVKNISAEIFVTDFEFIGGKKESQSGGGNAFADNGFTPASDDDSESVPF
jgi:single-strand DNA-binding protein